MNVLFANIPFIKYDEDGGIRTGPNAGSRWPWTAPGITDYACFPFFMAYAVNYLKMNGVNANYYDGVALKHWDYESVRSAIVNFNPDILFLETSTPLFSIIKKFAIWAKEALSCRIVLTGPHVAVYAEELVRESFVDHCVIGEYEKPALDIVLGGKNVKTIYTYEHLENIDTVGDENFMPFRPMEYLFNYYEPTMNTPIPQLAVSTSRGCPFKCTYCQWPKVMNNGRYRTRQPALVLDEIKEVLDQYRRHRLRSVVDVSLAPQILRDTLRQFRTRRRHLGMRQTIQSLWRKPWEIGSILFDDDTWNVGSKRVAELSEGLKQIGLPWTMMGRIDTLALDHYDLMVDSGCVGMRFGVESFSQRLLDNTKKKMDAAKSYANIKYLITRFSGLEFHFTTMKNLPGQTELDRQNDIRILDELKTLGERSRNVIHWQISDCIAFPGTELWEEMITAGKGDLLRDFELYDGAPNNSRKLAEAMGWLGANYKPKPSDYSNMGEPTELPEE
ncbi:MAG: B12-binding domain-containing radical SAM protein [Desulfomonilaceae bacterium]